MYYLFLTMVDASPVACSSRVAELREIARRVYPAFVIRYCDKPQYPQYPRLLPVYETYGEF